ncbi:MAG: head GIN domain-containing protein [Bacteroidota bacterium]
MKRGIILSVIIVAMTLTAGFSNGQSIVKETRDVSGFTRVSFGVSGDLYINFGSEFKVVLEGEKALLGDIVTEVSGDKLVIKKENWRLNMNEKVTIYITMPEIKGLGVSGSGRAEIKDAVKAENLNLSVSGSGKLFTTDVVAADLNCSISGSGDIIIGGSGDATKADISISGSGNYRGEPLKIGSAEISISGSGNCSCNVTGSLRASVSGSGNVTYLGDPKVDVRVSGSGRVRSK